MNQKQFKDPPLSFRSFFKICTGTFFCTVLFALLLFTNFAQMVSLIILPFSRKSFRAFNRFCANTWWGASVLVAHHFQGTRLTVTGDVIPIQENAIMFSNHQQIPDICVIMMYARTKKRLGDLKFFAKHIIKYIPGAGWGMIFLDALYVKRNWEADQKMIGSIFSKFVKEKIPMWLVSFVEGTRITPEKLARSQKFARANNLPVLENVMLPRTKGFVASMQGLKGQVTSVYDMTIGYPDGIPTVWQLFKGAATQVHVNVRRFPVNELPEDPEALSDWLVGRFQEKDLLMRYFLQNRKFPDSRKTSPTELNTLTATVQF